MENISLITSMMNFVSFGVYKAPKDALPSNLHEKGKKFTATFNFNRGKPYDNAFCEIVKIENNFAYIKVY